MRYRNAEDRLLMEAMADRDSEALEAFYDRHHRIVHAWCRRALGDAAAAEELLEDIFWEIWRRADRYDASRGEPLAYLLTITRSRILDRLRAGSRRPRLVVPLEDPSGAARSPEPVSGSPDPFEDAVATERRERIRKAMQRLDERQRTAVEMSFYDGLSHGEIAQSLNLPLGTIKTHIRQGLIRIRTALLELYGAEVSS